MPDSKVSPLRRPLYPIIPLTKFYAAMGWSRATGAKRRADDPDFPELTLIGPQRYGVRQDRALHYQAVLAKRVKVVSASTATQLDSARAKELARLSNAKREANKAAAKALAEVQGALSPAKKSPKHKRVPNGSPKAAP